MWELLSKGGPTIYVILLCSFWGVYIIVKKVLFLRYNHTHLNALAKTIKQQLPQLGKKETINRLRHNRSFAAKSFTAILSASNKSPKEISQTLTKVTQKELPVLEKNLNILSSIITVAPLLGLLGTVLGLMDIFNVLSGGIMSDPSILAKGIGEALITTVAGLSIAIPFIFLHQFLSHKIELFIIDLEHNTNEILMLVPSNKEGVLS